MIFPHQSQSQGSITLKIIPAVAEDDKLKESRVRAEPVYNNMNIFYYELNTSDKSNKANYSFYSQLICIVPPILKLSALKKTNKQATLKE